MTTASAVELIFHLTGEVLSASVWDWWTNQPTSRAIPIWKARAFGQEEDVNDRFLEIDGNLHMSWRSALSNDHRRAEILNRLNIPSDANVFFGPIEPLTFDRHGSSVEAIV